MICKQPQTKRCSEECKRRYKEWWHQVQIAQKKRKSQAAGIPPTWFRLDQGYWVPGAQGEECQGLVNPAI